MRAIYNEIAILVFFIVAVLLLRKYNPVKVTFHLPQDAPIDNSLRRMLQKHDVVPTSKPKDGDILILHPDTTDASLPSLQNKLKPGQFVCHVSGEQDLNLRFNMWTAFENKLGRRVSCKYVPESFVIRGDSASDDYSEFLEQKTGDNHTVYLLKSESDGVDSLYLSDHDIADILKEIANNNLVTRTFASSFATANDVYRSQYTVVQKCIRNPLLVLGRVFKLQLYVVFSNISKQTRCYMHRNGLVYWAKEKYNRAAPYLDSTIASRKRMRKGRTPQQANQIYARYANTLQGLIEQLISSGIDTTKLFTSIVSLVKVFCFVAADYLGNLLEKNSTFHLYNIDVILDDTLRPFLLKFGRAKQLRDPTRVERAVHDRAWEDALKVHNIVLDGQPAGFTLVYGDEPTIPM